MNVTETKIRNLLIITPVIHRDFRGAFWETYNQRVLRDYGLPESWPQDNFSISRRNVVRGLHYQLKQAQGKLVRVVQGVAFDVAVDLRRSSPTFGETLSVELSADNGKILWIPPGFGHGFAALSDCVALAYKVTDFYSPENERTILWNDPDLRIDWPVDEKDAIVAEKDKQGSRLKDAEVFP